MKGKQLVQGSYAVVWARVEPTTFELQGINLSTDHGAHGCITADVIVGLRINAEVNHWLPLMVGHWFQFSMRYGSSQTSYLDIWVKDRRGKRTINDDDDDDNYDDHLTRISQNKLQLKLARPKRYVCIQQVSAPDFFLSLLTPITHSCVPSTTYKATFVVYYGTLYPNWDVFGRPGNVGIRYLQQAASSR